MQKFAFLGTFLYQTFLRRVPSPRCLSPDVTSPDVFSLFKKPPSCYSSTLPLLRGENVSGCRLFHMPLALRAFKLAESLLLSFIFFFSLFIRRVHLMMKAFRSLVCFLVRERESRGDESWAFLRHASFGSV